MIDKFEDRLIKLLCLNGIKLPILNTDAGYSLNDFWFANMDVQDINKIFKTVKTNFEDFFAESLRANQTQVDLNFQFQTKMDDFKIGKVSLSGALKKSSLSQDEE